MKLEPMKIGCDLSESSIDEAARLLGAKTGDVTVYCGRANASRARQAQAVHGFEAVIVPDDLLASPDPSRAFLSSYTWAVVYAGRMIGCLGGAG